MNNSNICFPDYQNSILNLITSITANFGVPSHHRELSGLKASFLNSYKNIILLVLDGLGYNLFSYVKNTKKIFDYNCRISKINSVFPPTTSAAITTLLTGKSPLEHGAIGWTLYFKEFAKYIDFLPNWDSITSKVLSQDKYPTLQILDHENIFTKINEINPEIDSYYLTPSYIHKSPYTVKYSNPAKVIPFTANRELFSSLHQIINKIGQKRKFIYIYNTDPDALEHRNGVFSQPVIDFLVKIDSFIKEFIRENKAGETLLLITADHGLIDVNNYHYSNEDRELYSTMLMPTFPEPRFSSFFIKESQKNKFLAEISKYKQKYMILSREDFLAKKLLGTGKPHIKIDDFIGDFLVIAKSDSALKTIFQQNGKWEKEFRAHHAGITCDEMEVPLLEIKL